MIKVNVKRKSMQISWCDWGISKYKIWLPEFIGVSIGLRALWLRHLAFVILLTLGSIPITLLMSAKTWAIEYARILKPVDERGIPLAPPRDSSVCATYGQGLNEWVRRPKKTHACEGLEGMNNPTIVRPNWTKLDLIQNIELLKKLDRMLFFDLKVIGPKQSFDESKWLAGLKERMEEGRISIAITKLDLNWDGYAEKLVRYQYGSCDEVGSAQPVAIGRPNHDYFVVDENMQEALWVYVAPNASFFTYHGKAYADFVGVSSGDIWVSEAAELIAPVSENQCGSRFHPSTCAVDQRPAFSFVRACQYRHLLKKSSREKLSHDYVQQH